MLGVDFGSRKRQVEKTLTLHSNMLLKSASPTTMYHIPEVVTALMLLPCCSNSSHLDIQSG